MPSETGPVQGNRTTMYLLGAIVVLLAVVAAIVIFKQPAASTPNQTAQQPSSSLATPTTNQMPGIAPSAGADFDPAKATKVTAKSPEEHVKAYYEAILAKKWDVAFKLQPALSQAGGSVEDFQATQTSYGMTAYKVLSAKTEGDTSTVDIEQDLGSNGKWGALWTFVKYNGAWVVQSRKVSMK